MKILITGSTGFVGRHLVPQLLQNEHQVLEITRSLIVSRNLFGELTEKYLLSDDQDELRNKIDVFQPDAVIHLASYITSDYDYTSMLEIVNSNILFPCRLMDALQNIKVRIVINTGTFAEYSTDQDSFNPAYLYGASKTASRFLLKYYCKLFKFKLVTVVPYTIYGGFYSSKKVIDLIFDSLNSSNPINLSSGYQVLDFVHIEDVVKFYTTLVENNEQVPDDSDFHIGTGVGHNLREVAELMERITGMNANIKWGGRPYRKTDIMYAVAKIIVNTKLLNWQPSINLEAGLRKYIMEKRNGLL